MENSDILAMTFELREKIMNSDLYRDLKEKEKNMIDDKECFRLLNDYQAAQDRYNEAKRFEKYGGKVEETQKQLSEMKKKVNEHKLVKEYNLAYKKMKKELNEIETIIFMDIIKNKKRIEIE